MSIKNDTWYDQLDQFRKHIIAWGKIFCLLFVIIYPFNQELYRELASPLMLNKTQVIIATRVVSPFTTPLKLSAFTAFTISMPFMIWQIWQYLRPAMRSNERKLLAWLVTTGTSLFIIGIIFCFNWALPATIKVFQKLTPSNVTYMPDMDQYLDFALSLAIAFGLCFEVPIILISLVKFGVLKLDTLIHRRKEVIVLCFTIAMLVTPPDVTSQVLMALPMIALYELSIIVCKITGKKQLKLD